MNNFIELKAKDIRAIVKKTDAVLLYTSFGLFVCKPEPPQVLENDMLRYFLKERAEK